MLLPSVVERLAGIPPIGNDQGPYEEIGLHGFAAPASSQQRLPRIGIAMVGALLFVVGCAPQTPSATHPRASDSLEWNFNGVSGKVIKTPHYLIHTTIDDAVFLESLTQVMEGALQEYRKLAPGVQLSPKPMECYVFARRQQWEQFTSRHTGDDAAIYLQINRGGYTVRDWFVAYFIGDVGTFAVAAHEGWHQYVARNFKSRLPPFLEEGMATMFENISWSMSGPRWNMLSNPNRADKLRVAIQDNSLWSLEQLCTMHAGDVVSLSGERIETFYAQNWAFAQFLFLAENGKYQPALRRMLDDLASGASDAYTGKPRGPSDSWDPRTVRPLLEHYLGMSIAQIDTAYQAYIRQIANAVRPSRDGH